MESQLPESGFGSCLSLWAISVMLSGPSFSQGYVAIYLFPSSLREAGQDLLTRPSK